jgi:hypothetical protein
MSGAHPAKSPGSPAPSPSGMPPSARVSVVLLAVLAVLLLTSALLTLGGRDGVVEQYLRSQPEATRADADRFLLLIVLQGLGFGGLAAVSAAFLARRREWARWAGAATCGLLGLLTIWLSVGVGGIAITSLLLVVLCAGAVSSLLVRTTAAWTRAGS